MRPYGWSRHVRAFLTGMTLVAALLAGSDRATFAAAGGATMFGLPNRDNYVSDQELAVPTPAPRSFGYPVDDINSSGQPQWSGVPLMLPSGVMVAFLPATDATCAGSATNQVCAPVDTIDAYDAGYFPGLTWRYALPKRATASQPVQDGDTIAFLETLNAASPSDAQLRLVRLTEGGKPVSNTPISLPKPLVDQFGLVSDGLWPAPSGAVLFVGVSGVESFVEKLRPDGYVAWSQPAVGVTWAGGPVTLVSTRAKRYEAIATSTGRVLWTTPEDGYTAAVDGSVAMFYGPSPAKANVTWLVARATGTGRELWARALADVVQQPRTTFPQRLVFADGALILCASPAAADRNPGLRALCMEYVLRTGHLAHAMAVPNASGESVVDPIASSRRYLLVQVAQPPWADCSSGQPVWTCRPFNTITEAIPWSGKGPVRISQGGADQQLTYDVGKTPVTVTTATSSWRW
jgi:hypothetical protein